MWQFIVNQSGYSEDVWKLSIEQLIATAVNPINASDNFNPILLIKLLTWQSTYYFLIN